MEMKAWTRGEDDALVRFTAPAEGRRQRHPEARQRHLGLQSEAQPGDQAARQHDEPVVDGLGLLLQRPLQVRGHHQRLHPSAGRHRAGRRPHGLDHRGRRRSPARRWSGARSSLEVRDDYVLVERDLLRPGHEAGPAHDRRQDRAARPAGAYPVVMTMHPLDQPTQWTRIETADAQLQRRRRRTTSSRSPTCRTRGPERCWPRSPGAISGGGRSARSSACSASRIVSGLLVFVLSFQDGVYATMKETTLRIFDGYAQLQPDRLRRRPDPRPHHRQPRAGGARGRGRRRASPPPRRGSTASPSWPTARAATRAAVVGVDPGQRGEDLLHRPTHSRRPLPDRRRHRPGDPGRHPGQESRRRTSAAR